MFVLTFRACLTLQQAPEQVLVMMLPFPGPFPMRKCPICGISLGQHQCGGTLHHRLRGVNLFGRLSFHYRESSNSFFSIEKEVVTLWQNFGHKMKFPLHAGNHWREYFYNTSIQINPGIPVIVWSPVKISNKPVTGFSPRCSDTVSFHCAAQPAMPTDIQGYTPVVQAPCLVLEGDTGFTMLQGLHLSLPTKPGQSSSPLLIPWVTQPLGESSLNVKQSELIAI